MKSTAALLAIPAVLLLSACNHSASVTADSAQSTGFKGEFSQANTDSQSAAKIQRTTSKQQLLTALIDASQKTEDEYESRYFGHFKNDDYQKFKAGFELNADMRGRLIEWQYTDKPFDHAVFADDAGMRQYTKLLLLPDKIDDWFLPLDEKAQKYLKQGNLEAGRDFILRYWTLFLFNLAVQPSSGWPTIEGLNDDQAENRWISVSTHRIRFANLLASEIARMLPTRHKTPSDLRSDFVVALDKMPNAAIYQIFAQAKNEADADIKAGIMVDKVTGRGTSWVAGVREYNGQFSGWTLKTGGQPTFGNGYIDGHLYETELASSLELTSKIDRSSRIGGSTGLDESSKGSVAAKTQ